MSPLSWFLACIIATSLLLILACGFFPSIRQGGRYFKWTLSLYALLVALILGLMIHYFIGWDSQVNTRIPKNLQRRMAHTGYYFGREGALELIGLDPTPQMRQPAPGVLSPASEPAETSEQNEALLELMPSDEPAVAGFRDRKDTEGHTNRNEEAADPILEDGFGNPTIQQGDSIKLKPIWSGDIATEWDLSYRVQGQPLRVSLSENGELVNRCVNVPPSAWLVSGDTIFITRPSGGETAFVAIRWDTGTKYWGPFKRAKNAYYFSEGKIRNGAVIYTRGPALLMSETLLSDGVLLASIVRHSKKQFRADVGTIDQEWWEMFDEISLVRELRGNRESRLGLLLGERFFKRPGVAVYRNYAGPSSLPFSSPGDAVTTTRVPASATISYGFQGRRNHFGLQLSREIVKDNIWGQVVHVTFAHPKLWPLPPEVNKDFIVTSSNDYLPLDGYFLSIGNSAHSFYAKGNLDDSLDTLSINDGRNVIRTASKDGPETFEPRRFPLGNSASIGDYEQGVLFSLLSSQSLERSAWWAQSISPKHTGRAAILLILINLACLVIVVLKQNITRPTLLLAWVLIWGVGITLLCIRLILIYRISLVPPLDSSIGEIRNVFDKGVDYALLGLLAFAFFNAVLYFARRGPRQSNVSRRRVTLLVLGWGLLILIYTVGGAMLGSNQAFLGLRISIADHLLLIVGLAILARQVVDKAKALAAVVIILTLGLEVLVVKDGGSIIYAWSMLFVIIALWGWRRRKYAIQNWVTSVLARFPRLRRAQRRVAVPLNRIGLTTSITVISEWAGPIIIPIAFVSSLLLLPYLVQSGSIRKVVEPAIPDTTFYRFASFTDSEDIILTTRSGQDTTDMTTLLNNSLQQWQMLLYASHGVDAPVGYGLSPLSKIGMTYPTSVSDCAFATYVLAEHGRATAILLLLLYLLLAVTCVIAAWHFDDNSRHRNIVLLAIAGFFACNSLYMASANVGLMTFTGQNVPMLGLGSGGDLLQGLALICLAGWLLLRSSQESKPKLLWQNHPVVFRWGIGLCVVGIIWLAAFSWQLNKLHKEDYRGNHDLKAGTFEEIVKDLPPESAIPNLRQNAPLVLNGEKLERAPGGILTEVEEQYRKQLNERTDKFNSQGGLYYLERPPGLGSQPLQVKVNRRFFFAQSPFDAVTQWRGRIVAGGDNDPTLYALASRFKVSLKTGGLPASIDLVNPTSLLTNSAVVIREGNRQFFELRRAGSQLTLDVYKGDWSVFVNGQPVNRPTPLDPLSIIVIERRDTERHRRTLIYLGPTGPVLAYVRWRNGEQRRMFPEGGNTLAYFLGKAGDKAVAMETKADLPISERLGPELQVTLNLPLQQDLQRLITRYARNNNNYDPLRPYPNRLSITVLDAFGGDVLALPYWPLVDPNKTQYEKLIDRVSEPTRSRFEVNSNVVADHVVGSTLKPVVFTTMATQLWGNWDLAKFRVFNRNDSSRTANQSGPSQHPHTRIGGINIEVWDCNSTKAESDMKEFIVQSLDFPVGVLGMLGMVMNQQEVSSVLVRDEASPNVSYDGSGYSFDLQKVPPNQTAFTLQNQFERRLALPRAQGVINQTLLFSGLNSLFDFDTANTRAVRLQKACRSFLPMFDNAKLPLEKNEYLDNLIPKRSEMSSGDFQGIRQGLISCFLGGAPCSFSNVMMAEAAARLATGKRIFAKLEALPLTEPGDLPGPLGNSTWRTENVITPMEMVGRIGTASAFSGSKSTRISIPTSYRAIFKTGTIVEGNEGRESESLMFTIGRWDNGHFVPGETVSGFLFMEKSKVKDDQQADGNMKKFAFAAPLLNRIVEHLVRIRQ